MTDRISGGAFKDMVAFGAACIAQQKQAINDLNVFPVPDGDTGTNMSLTIQTAVAELRKVQPATVDEAAKVTASGLLRGARGNSGVILSLLFRGMSKVFKGLTEADGAQLASAMQEGVSTAYGAVMKPAEGTVLTVSRLAAQRALEAAGERNDAAYVLEEAIKTGYTTPAGMCLAAACVKGDYTYYSVVLGAEKVDGVDGRFAETIKLFNYGAANWSQQVMLSSSEPIAEVPVRLSADQDTVVVRPSENITAMLPNTFETGDLKLDYTLEEDVAAPVQQGDVLGKLTVRYGDKSYALDLVAAASVERSTMLYVLDCVTGFFVSTTFKVIVAALVALVVIFVAYMILINRKRAKRRKNRRH